MNQNPSLFRTRMFIRLSLTLIYILSGIDRLGILELLLTRSVPHSRDRSVSPPEHPSPHHSS